MTFKYKYKKLQYISTRHAYISTMHSYIIINWQPYLKGQYRKYATFISLKCLTPGFVQTGININIINKPGFHWRFTGMKPNYNDKYNSLMFI